MAFILQCGTELFHHRLGYPFNQFFIHNSFFLLFCSPGVTGHPLCACRGNDGTARLLPNYKIIMNACRTGY